MPFKFDYLVIGGGVAGLSFALEAAQNGSVAVLTKRARHEGNTQYAQGGIASVLAADDSFEQHVQDTLIAAGAEFDRNAVGELDLTREGGHSKRRIVHAGDITGREVERALLHACDETKNVVFFPNTTAIDLIRDSQGGRGRARCVGVYALLEDGNIETFLGKATVLASGGAGKVYLYTNNPDVATGDGVAMAYRAGAQIANMEFYQFHPTCLYHPEAKNFLISEALR